MSGKTGAKRFLKIMNAVIILICATAICGFFVMPLWRIDVRLTATEELAGTVGEYISKSGAADSGAVASVLGEICKNEPSIEFSVRVGTAEALAALFSGSTDAGRELIVRNAAGIAGSVVPALAEIAVPAASRLVLDGAVGSLIDEALKNGGAVAEENISKVLDEAGISEEWIKGRLDEVIESVTSPDATADGVSDTVMDMLDEIMEKLGGVAESAGVADYYNEYRDEISNEVSKLLDGLSDDEGRLSADGVINKLILPAVEGYVSSGEFRLPEGFDISGLYGSAGTGVLKLSASPAAEPDTAGTAGDGIRDAVAVIIEKYAGDRLAGRVTTALEILAISVIIVWLFWACLAIKALVRIFSVRNPGVRLWAPIVFGWPHFTLLCVLPAAILRLSPARLVPGWPSGVIKVSFGTCGVICAFAALALVIISIFYIPKRRYLRNIYGK